MGWLPAGRLAYLYPMQITRLLFTLCMVLFIGQAFAYDDIPMRFTHQNSGEFESREDACTSYVHPSQGPFEWLTPSTCRSISNYSFFGTVQMVTTCVTSANVQFRNNFRGDVPDSRYATCRYLDSCPEGEIRQSDGSCSAPPPPDCEPGCNGACGSNKRFLNFRTRACIDQCIYKLHTGIGIQTTDGSWYYGHTVGDNTGVSCTPDMDNSLPDPQPCPECECIKKKQSYAVMQGVAVCLEPGTPGSEPVKKQDPPKVETHTPAPTPENPNPEPVVTETPSPVITITPAPAGSPAGTAPTITETTTNADGSSTATEQSQDSFCQANPTHKVCRQEDAKTDCDKYPDSLGCSVIGDVPEFEPLETKEIDMSSIVLRELPSDNSCPAPLYFTVGGKTIPISFEPICEYASAFKPLVIAVAWLSTAFIIVGARKDSI